MASRIRQFLLRLTNALWPHRPEPELSREMAAHLALLQDDFEARGMTPEEARSAARRAFGGVAQVSELHRDARSFRWLDEARQDARHAARLLRRDPIFAMTAVVSLAIGIGANTTIFTVASALLFQPPAGVEKPEELVDIGGTRGGGIVGPSSYSNYLDLRARATTLAGVYAYSRFPQAMSFRGGGPDTAVEAVSASMVSINYFAVLGTAPAAGRLMGAADSERSGASPVVVLSHLFWSRRFNRDPGVVGRTVFLNGRPFSIVGVAAERFHGTGLRALDLWVPITMLTDLNPRTSSALTDRAANRWLIGGRLRADADMSRAASEIDVIGRTLEREQPEQNQGLRFRLMPLSQVPGGGGPIVAFLALLMAIVSLVLIVACANVAGVLLARAAARRQEMALRLAIGAGRARLVRQLLTETLLLFALGGSAGLVLARVLTSLLVARLPALPFPVELSLALDIRVVAFTAGLSLLTALLSGLAPALQASRASVITGLRNDAGLAGRLRLRYAFVIGQVVFSVVLVIVAGLFVRALQRAATADSGFDPHAVQLASIDLAQAGYTETTGPRFVQDLTDRIRQLPGVEHASAASGVPGGFEVWRQALAVPGVTPPAGRFFVVDWTVVEPDYFASLRTRLTSGRDFGPADRAGTREVAIVSESAARDFWPGQDAVGKSLLLPTWGPQGPADPLRPLLVIAVARDIQSTTLIDGASRSCVYVPLAQQFVPGLTLAVRTSRGHRLDNQLRALVASMDPALPIMSIQTLEDSVSLGLAPQRITASVSGGLGIVGLLLAAIGIYGVTAYAVARRTREIGIRIALGARRIDIVRMVLREGLLLTLVGSGTGLLIAAAISQVLAGFLFGIPPIDPVTFAGTTVLFAAIGLAACYVPVRHATRIDPTRALRYD